MALGDFSVPGSYGQVELSVSSQPSKIQIPEITLSEFIGKKFSRMNLQTINRPNLFNRLNTLKNPNAIREDIIILLVLFANEDHINAEMLCRQLRSVAGYNRIVNDALAIIEERKQEALNRRNYAQILLVQAAREGAEMKQSQELIQRRMIEQ